MYAAAAFELGTSGLGTGAYSVLLLRITQKRFSATQYALFSSLFAVPRILAGPISGVTVEAIGWQVFYVSTMVLGIPGLLMLARFVPFGVREPAFDAEEPAPPPSGPPLTTSQLVTRGVVGGVVIGAGTLVMAALLAAFDAMRGASDAPFDYGAAFQQTIVPTGVGGWLQLVGILAFGVIGGLFVAAYAAARRRIG
jgi:PAT family beta-lactamase induction signal transducer AmpG